MISKVKQYIYFSIRITDLFIDLVIKLYILQFSYLLIIMIRLVINSTTAKILGARKINKDIGKLSYQMMRRNQYCFAVKNHPTIQKIIKGVDERNLNQIYSQIGALNEKNHELALKLLLKNVYINKLPLSVLTNDKLMMELTKNPQILVETILFKIKQHIKVLNQNLQKNNKENVVNSLSQINKCFVECYDNLEKIPRNQLLKTQVMLHKRFADYHLFYLSKLVDSTKAQQVLKKSIEFYKNIIDKMKILIIQGHEKIGLQNQKPQGKDQTQEEKEWKLNAIKQNLRMLIETNSQNILHLYYAEKKLKLKNAHQQHSQEQFKESVIYLQHEIQKALRFYQLLGKINAFSIFYHKLKKIMIEIKFYSKISGFKKFNKDPKEVKAFQEQSIKELNLQTQNLYKETTQDLKIVMKEPHHMGNIQELSILLFSLRMNKIKEYLHNADLYKEKIFEQVKNIIVLFSNEEDKKIIILTLSKLAKQLISRENTQSKRNN